MLFRSKALVLPMKNKKDVLEEVPDDVRSELQFDFVEDVARVLEIALEPKPNALLKSGDKEPKGDAKQPRAVATKLIAPSTTMH